MRWSLCSIRIHWKPRIDGRSILFTILTLYGYSEDSVKMLRIFQCFGIIIIMLMLICFQHFIIFKDKCTHGRFAYCFFYSGGITALRISHFCETARDAIILYPSSDGIENWNCNYCNCTKRCMYIHTYLQLYDMSVCLTMNSIFSICATRTYSFVHTFVVYVFWEESER